MTRKIPWGEEPLFACIVVALVDEFGIWHRETLTLGRLLDPQPRPEARNHPDRRSTFDPYGRNEAS